MWPVEEGIQPCRAPDCLLVSNSTVLLVEIKAESLEGLPLGDSGKRYLSTGLFIRRCCGQFAVGPKETKENLIGERKLRKGRRQK